MAKKFIVEVERKWCKGCELCLEVCPKKVLEMDADVKCHAARPDDCIGCRQCDNICPDMAITVKEVE